MFSLAIYLISSQILGKYNIISHMSKDTFILFLILVTLAIASQDEIYKKFAIYQTNTSIDAFSAFKQDEVKIAIGSRIGGKYSIRIFQLIQSNQSVDLKDVLSLIDAQDIYMRFSDKGKYLIIAIDHREIRIFKEMEDKAKNKIYSSIQNITFQQGMHTINVCQKHPIFAISVEKKIVIYKLQNDKFQSNIEFDFNEEITAISISPNQNWISVSNGRIVIVLQIFDTYLSKQSTVYMQDNFQIDFIITIDQTLEVFTLHQEKQKNGNGSIRIFGQNATNPHQYFQKERFNNFTDFPRSMSVSDNGKILAFFTQHNRIWIYQRNVGTKMKCSYCLRQSFNTSKSKLNHLWATSNGQYLIMTDETGQVSLFKNMQHEQRSSTLVIIIIIVAACIIGFLIYYFRDKKVISQEKRDYYQEMKQTPKF